MESFRTQEPACRVFTLTIQTLHRAAVWAFENKILKQSQNHNIPDLFSRGKLNLRFLTKSTNIFIKNVKIAIKPMIMIITHRLRKMNIIQSVVVYDQAPPNPPTLSVGTATIILNQNVMPRGITSTAVPYL
ncbi:MAG: hypothetical protein B5766_09240 [Candidatus Lumbricidophila eiseniae]|uniref:Uncharacterized protein n=1 Tax=Candidatus Lumbricidiphila eiseniae TaxID=1969409 RepID=A0A2A6FPX4_9MICO|nr:MAG: hypothetical protein B5766_09240 [Candidatus Lumbricidophila eiseniae]